MRFATFCRRLRGTDYVDDDQDYRANRLPHGLAKRTDENAGPDGFDGVG